MSNKFHGPKPPRFSCPAPLSFNECKGVIKAIPKLFAPSCVVTFNRSEDDAKGLADESHYNL